jgi:hypothetical protein
MGDSVDCECRETEAKAAALLASPIRQGERTEVRGLWSLKKTLTLPLSLKGRGDPICLKSIPHAEPHELRTSRRNAHESARLNFLQ